MKYKISYSQSFNGETLHDSYVQEFKSLGEAMQACARMMNNDDHVFWADAERVEE